MINDILRKLYYLNEIKKPKATLDLKLKIHILCKTYFENDLDDCMKTLL